MATFGNLFRAPLSRNRRIFSPTTGAHDVRSLTTSVEFLVNRIRATSDHPADNRLGDVDKFVTWRSFLCVMALPVIAARPNTWGGSDYVAFLQDDHVGLLGSMRFPLDLASDKSSEAGNTESDDRSREAADDKSQGALSRQSGKE